MAAGAALILAATSFGAAAGEYTGPGFSGDAFVANGGEPLRQVGTVSVGAGGFRMDIVDQGRRMASLITWSSDTAYSLFLDDKVYMEMSAEQIGMEPYEDRPCVGYRSAEPAGSDTVGGRPVEKWRCTGELAPPRGRAPSNATTWYDRELAFELRVARDGGDVFEVRNVSVGGQDESLFRIPAGFRKLDMQALMKQMMEQQQGR